uniref:Uncharacterized protein n=1 Tax=Oryza rufipogon TaxID=4529 RepID=A0A0E0N2J5_ORYRU
MTAATDCSQCHAPPTFLILRCPTPLSASTQVYMFVCTSSIAEGKIWFGSPWRWRFLASMRDGGAIAATASMRDDGATASIRWRGGLDARQRWRAPCATAARRRRLAWTAVDGRDETLFLLARSYP